MPADDQLPAGWTYSAAVGAVQNTLTVPATPGVTHVLDSFTAKAFSSGAALTYQEAVQLVSPGIYATAFILGYLFFVATAAAGGIDETNQTLINQMGAAGEQIQVFIPGAANVITFLLIQGHDI